MDKKIGHPQAALIAPLASSDNTAHSQRMRLLASLWEGTVSTTQARRELDIMHPAARIQELRALGHVIHTVWVDELTSTRRIRHIARYVLVKGAKDD